MLTSHEITADYLVTPADARAERDAAPRWYVLPEGWTWERVASHRMVWGQPPEHFPVATAFGVAAWGVPVRPIKERIRLPYDARREFFGLLATASAARRVPGGALAARGAVQRARFLRSEAAISRLSGA